MLYYKLKNGETIELKINNKTDKNYNTKTEIEIVLFNGSTTILYEYNNFEQIDLNKIFNEIEENYNKLRAEDTQNYFDAYAN